jgi:hypothetical protein
MADLFALNILNEVVEQSVVPVEVPGASVTG